MDKRKFTSIQKPKKFIPVTNPRFPRFGHTIMEIEEELKFYNQHRFRLFSVKPTVDTKPPMFNHRKLYDDITIRARAKRFDQIAADNQLLLKKINTINRSRGVVHSHNPFAFEPYIHSKWHTHKKNMLDIINENKVIYSRIVNTDPVYKTKIFEDAYKETIKRMEKMASYPLYSLKRKTQDDLVNEMPSISDVQNPPSRPKCYLDFKIKDGVQLGRIVIELYEDVMPLTCKNFIALCKGTNGLSYRNCRVYNVLRGKYFECGDVTLNNGKGGCSIYGKDFEEEKKILKHTKPGVVSMVPVQEGRNNSIFSITFEAVEEIDNKHVAFGKVIKGMKTINYIQDLGKRFRGLPMSTVIIAKCGEVKLKKNKAKKPIGNQQRRYHPCNCQCNSKKERCLKLESLN